jgi:hypothetical protein
VNHAKFPQRFLICPKEFFFNAVDENRWETVVGAPGMIAWQVLLAAIHVATLIFTIVMFGFSVKQQGCRLNVVQFICISEALGLMSKWTRPLFNKRHTCLMFGPVLLIQ